MRSAFAKFTDGTLGAALLFMAATAVLSRLIPLQLAAIAALSVTASAFLIIGHREKKGYGRQKISRGAEEMFFAFMFERKTLPAERLAAALTERGLTVTRRGACVTCGKTASFLRLNEQLTHAAIARDVSLAAKKGATEIIEFCERSSPPFPAIAGVKIRQVCGDDVYRLFASLDILPSARYEKTPRRRFQALRGALGKDRIVRYLLLSAMLFGVHVLLGGHIITLVCAAIAAALFISSAVYNVARRAKPN